MVKRQLLTVTVIDDNHAALTDRPSRKEWYEIRPLSVSGMVEWGVKFAGITGYITEHGLPCVPGFITRERRR